MHETLQSRQSAVPTISYQLSRQGLIYNTIKNKAKAKISTNCDI